VIDQFVTTFFGNLMLALLNHRIGKLYDLPAADTDHVIVVFTFGQLKY
jgi:hypothetical protein